MPFYQQGDLETYLLQHPDLSFQTRLNILIDILVGLMHLHARFIIHRDIKLKNIFVDQAGRCVVGDLGVATITEDAAISRLGTFLVTAPEVYSQNQYDEAVDMWATGILAFQILNPLRNGAIPFPFDESPDRIDQLRQSREGVNYKQYMEFT